MQDSDPYANEIKLIKETLDIIFDEKGLVLNQNIINSSISLYLNFNSLLDKLDNTTKPKFNKKAIIALCIYYGASINSINITLQNLSILFKISISTIYDNNNILKKVYENTDYIKYFNLSSNIGCNIDLSRIDNFLLTKIKNHLINHVPEVTEPLDNKYYAGIIYYITNHIHKIRKYTLKELSTSCNVSQPIISKTSKIIENFYKKNPSLYMTLI